MNLVDKIEVAMHESDPEALLAIATKIEDVEWQTSLIQAANRMRRYEWAYDEHKDNQL